MCRKPLQRSCTIMSMDNVHKLISYQCTRSNEQFYKVVKRCCLSGKPFAAHIRHNFIVPQNSLTRENLFKWNYVSCNPFPIWYNCIPKQREYILYREQVTYQLAYFRTLLCCDTLRHCHGRHSSGLEERNQLYISCN